MYCVYFVGSNQTRTGQPSCGECPSGTAAPGDGSVECEACNKGKYQNGTGAVQCELCQEGEYCG